jgi:hypothetical protein
VSCSEEVEYDVYVVATCHVTQFESLYLSNGYVSPTDEKSGIQALSVPIQEPQKLNLPLVATKGISPLHRLDVSDDSAAKSPEPESKMTHISEVDWDQISSLGGSDPSDLIVESVPFVQLSEHGTINPDWFALSHHHDESKLWDQKAKSEPLVPKPTHLFDESEHYLVAKEQTTPWTPSDLRPTWPVIVERELGSGNIIAYCGCLFKKGQPIGLFLGDYVAPDKLEDAKARLKEHLVYVKPARDSEAWGLDTSNTFNKGHAANLQLRQCLDDLTKVSENDKLQNDDKNSQIRALEKKYDECDNIVQTSNPVLIPFGSESSNCELRFYGHNQLGTNGSTRRSCPSPDAHENVYVVATKDTLALEHLCLSNEIRQPFKVEASQLVTSPAKAGLHMLEHLAQLFMDPGSLQYRVA